MSLGTIKNIKGIDDWNKISDFFNDIDSPNIIVLDQRKPKIESVAVICDSEKLMKYPKNDEQKTHASYDVILELDVGELNEINILLHQKTIIHYIREALKKNESILNNIDKLMWLSETTELLANRRKLNIIIKDDRKKVNGGNKNVSGKSRNTSSEISQNITRSSYKFCEKGYECKNQAKCLSKHFVYNYLLYDINNLIEYIELNKDGTYNTKEIVTSIGVISYVINHMYDELSMFCQSS